MPNNGRQPAPTARHAGASENEAQAGAGQVAGAADRGLGIGITCHALGFPARRIRLNGTSAEFKYQVLSPYKDKVGLALYQEPGYGTIEEADGTRHQEIELEGKLILEKHWLEDKLISAFNYTLEPEWEKADGDSGFGVHLKMEGSFGLAYRIAPRWYAGLETRVQTEFENADLNRSQFVTVFVGPALHYGSNRWWATLTVLPQVWGWPDSSGTGGLTLDDHERLEVRLKVGFNF